MAETRLLRGIYDRSPRVVQDLMTSVYGYQKIRRRYGHPRYQYWFDLYTEQRNWNEEQLRSFQLTHLRQTLERAYHDVPFYRERFRERGLVPADIQCPADMQKLPYVTKHDIRWHRDRMLNEKLKKSGFETISTGGSTGQPLTVHSDREATICHHAIRWAQCRPGLRRGMKYANFTGQEIVDPDRTRPPFWRMNYPASQRLYSIYHMSDKYLGSYVADLNRFKPDFFYGYASAIYALADFMEREGLRLEKPLKAVVTSSEQLVDRFREKIEDVFETRLWDEYGQTERAALMFQCECGKLHENISFSLIEFIPTGQEEDGLPVHELICTSLVNQVWPLIRYQIGDTALIDPDAVCPLGRPGRVVERINGRTSHFLETSDGRRFTHIAVIAYHCRNIKYCQVVQSEPGEMTLRLVREAGFTAADEELAIREFRKTVGSEDKMIIRVEYADEPLLTNSGKLLMVIRQPRNQEQPHEV